MGKFKLLERLYIPTYNKPSHVQCGEVVFDYEKCTGDKLCSVICPADSIVMVDKKPQMKPSPMTECMACGACIAVCPTKAIHMKSTFRVLKGYLKTIDLGDILPPRTI